MENGFRDDLFGGIFDFNGDGKTSISEQWAGGFAFKECAQEDMSGVGQKSRPAENTDGAAEKNTLSEKGKENRQKKREAKRKAQLSEQEARRKARLAEQEKRKAYLEDKTIYTYCSVLLSPSLPPYAFRTEDQTIQIGDTVIVPVGKKEQEMKGKVVSIGQYSRIAVPYPVEQTKFILRRIEEDAK